jgi:hypothetical protein
MYNNPDKSLSGLCFVIVNPFVSGGTIGGILPERTGLVQLQSSYGQPLPKKINGLLSFNLVIHATWTILSSE